MSELDTSTISVILLAAGRGERMRPLTDTLPKPLLRVAGRSLIEHHLVRLASAGVQNVVINTAYLADKIKHELGDGAQFNLNIKYSDESDTGALETAGGIKKAIQLIRGDVFFVVNADIWTDFDFASQLKNSITSREIKGRLILVPNPDHNRDGDFAINNNGKLSNSGTKYTFSGIALYQRKMFDDLAEGKQALGPIFRELIEQKQLEGAIYRGEWTDVGTPQRLEALNRRVLEKQSRES